MEFTFSECIKCMRHVLHEINVLKKIRMKWRCAPLRKWFNSLLCFWWVWLALYRSSQRLISLNFESNNIAEQMQEHKQQQQQIKHFFVANLFHHLHWIELKTRKFSTLFGTLKLLSCSFLQLQLFCRLRPTRRCLRSFWESQLTQEPTIISCALPSFYIV